MLNFTRFLPALGDAQWLAALMFGVLAFSLYHFARKPLGDKR